MKVFRLNDYEWWMAPTLEEAIEDAMRYSGLPAGEAADEDACEVSEAEMHSLIFNDEDGTKRTFAEELSRSVANGEPTQCFASTEC